MNKFINSTLDLEYSNDVLLVTAMLKKWSEEKPDNKELQEVVRAFMNCVYYTNKVTMERYGYDKYCSDARDERNRAILRARSAEEQIEKLQEQLKLAKYEL